jgi:hypothetical protein
MDIPKLLKKSDIHSEIVRFFHENPACIESPRGISVWVRADVSKVKPVLEELTRSGVLVAHKVSSTTGYSYTRNDKIISMVRVIFKLK